MITIICKICGAELIGGAKFCSVCGSKIEEKKICLECGTELMENEIFCHNCGYRIKESFLSQIEDEKKEESVGNIIASESKSEEELAESSWDDEKEEIIAEDGKLYVAKTNTAEENFSPRLKTNNEVAKKEKNKIKFWVTILIGGLIVYCIIALSIVLLQITIYGVTLYLTAFCRPIDFLLTRGENLIGWIPIFSILISFSLSYCLCWIIFYRKKH